MKKIYKLLAFLIPLVFAAMPLEGSTCHSFKIKANAQEKEDITYIVHTLASNSTLGLWKYQKSLEAAGDRTRKVTALEFFAYIVTTPALKADLIKIIKKGGLPYKRFINGFNKNFNAEAASECFENNFAGFCKLCKVDVKTLEPLFKRGAELSSKNSGVPYGSFVKALVL